MASSAEVRLMLNAVDNASKVIGDVTTSMGSMAKITKSAGDFASGLGININELSNPAMLAGKAVKFLADETQKAVDNTADYSLKIGDLAQNLGISTEETSRIVQVSDDFRVSQEEVTNALQMAVKRGMAPSIDTLAKMADRYREIQDPNQRANELSEVFGRNWTALVPLLKQGGDAIRQNAREQNNALIVTKDSLKAAEDYKKAQDNLNDTHEAISQTLGNMFMPIESKFLRLLNDELTGKKSIIEANKAFWFGIEKNTEATDIYARSSHAAVVVNKELEETYNTMPQAIQDYITATDNAWTSTITASGAMETYTTQLLYNKAAEGLTADAALALAESMGLVDERTVYVTQRLAELKTMYDTNRDGAIDSTEATKGYTQAVTDLGNMVNTLPKNYTIDIWVKAHIPDMSDISEHIGGAIGDGEAVGGSGVVPPGHPNDSYFLPLTSGEQWTVKPTTNYTMNVYSNASTSTVTRDFQIMRSMQRH